MEKRAVLLVLLVVGAGVGAVVSGTPAAAQAAASPTVSVDVDGAPLDHGETYHTPTDPWIRVQASADAPVSLIEVRVDGTTRHEFEPSSETVDRNVVLDLETGDHRVSVVARADGVTTHEATVVKDDADPRVSYADPVEATPLDNVPANVTVTDSRLTLAGTIDDASSIEYVRIDHAYEYERADARDGDDDDGSFAYDVDEAPYSPDVQLPVDEGESDDDDDGDADDVERREQHTIASPGTEFDESLTLALGTNYLRIVVEDAAGNTQAEHLAVTVEDDDRPSLNVTHVEWISPTRLRVVGWASDEVQMNDVWVQEIQNTTDDDEATETPADRDDADDGDDDANETQNVTVRHRMVFRQPTVPDRSKRNVSFDTTVYHPPGNDTLVVGANDTARNDRVRNYSLSTFLAPTITVADERTGYVDDRTVAVGGRVFDGQIGGVSVEAVDPSTDRIVDIRPVDLGANGTFDVRLDGVDESTQIRVRVRDASGAEHVERATVSEPAEDPAPPPSDGGGEDGGDGAGGSDGDGGSADADADAPAEIRIPVVGVTIPVPTLGVPAPLDASLSIPLPFVGPVDVPVAPVGLVLLLLVAVAVRRR